MPVIALILFLILLCVVLYIVNMVMPGMITPEANRLIWIVVSVVVLVLLLAWALGVFGFNVAGLAMWGPRLR